MKLAIDIHSEIINLYKLDSCSASIAPYKFSANSIDSIKCKILEYITDIDQITGIGICAKKSTILNNIVKACQSIFTVDTWVFNDVECRKKFNLPTNTSISEYSPAQLAAAIAVRKLYPYDHFIIVDINTTTTINVYNKDDTYLGGVILPGSVLGNLDQHATNSNLLSTKPAEQIKSGNYYAMFYGLKGLLDDICDSYFNRDIPIIIATGEFANIWGKSGIFDEVIPNLVALGTIHAFEIVS